MKTIRIPFRFEEGSVLATQNVDTVVKQQIVNYFMTNLGERIMNSSYGGNLPNLVFEINDPLIFADYKVDALSEVNSYLSFGKVLDFGFVDSTNDLSAENNVATLVVRYSVAPRTISTVKLVVNTTFTEESPI